ncbi:MAG: hypothetical protein A2Y33_15175 [Spirochaetes bacterium GWF1_51_8]|nr:MAG: hypothetical protein A2Y33_15175 [Spirochaetes bacterium GWF1_51_8]
MFYQSVASFYDDMTGYTEWESYSQDAIRSLISKYPSQSLLDSACGTGIYAIAGAKLGLRVTGVDIVPEMIDKAKINSHNAGVNVDWNVGDIRHLDSAVTEQHDLVICMGNTIPHLLKDSDLQEACSSFYSSLNHGGALVLEFLNYPRILKFSERIISINRKDDREFVRFYDFVDLKEIVFNILEISWEGNKAKERQIHSLKLRPYFPEAVIGSLKRSGFEVSGIWEDPFFHEFHEHKSETVVIAAIKK